MNFLEWLRMKLIFRENVRVMEAWRESILIGGDFVHQSNYSKMTTLIVNEIKHLFRKRHQATLTDAMREWQFYLKKKRLEVIFIDVGDIIHGKNYPDDSLFIHDFSLLNRYCPSFNHDYRYLS